MNLVCSDEDTRNKHVPKKQWLYLESAMMIHAVDLHGFGMIFIIGGAPKSIFLLDPGSPRSFMKKSETFNETSALNSTLQVLW